MFVDVMLGGDKVSLVGVQPGRRSRRAAHAARRPTDPADPGRADIAAAIAGPGSTAGGATSIGDSIHEGRLTLAGAAAAVASLVVLTDGKQNQPLLDRRRRGGDRRAHVRHRLGTAANTSAAELQTALRQPRRLPPRDRPDHGRQPFVLQKYFLQILSGISNARSSSTRPASWCRARSSASRSAHRRRRAVDVILLTDEPEKCRFRLQTPRGQLIDPDAAPHLAGVEFVTGAEVAYYRLTFPAEVRAGGRSTKGPCTPSSSLAGPRQDEDRPVGRRAAPSRWIVHVWSDLALTGARPSGRLRAREQPLSITAYDGPTPS